MEGIGVVPSFIVCSRPLDGRYANCSKTITVGHEVFPIEPDEYGNGFDGGEFPSGTETYTENLIDGQWHQETLPMSMTGAADALSKRLGKKCETPQAGKEVTNKDGDFAYMIKEL